MSEITRRELAIAIAASCLVAVLMSWPLVTRLSTHVPYDLGDPVLTTWETAWGGHALRTTNTSVWQANIFRPSRDTFAFTDSLLGLAPFSVVGNGPRAAVVRHGLFWIASYAVALLGAYLLARELGIGPAGAAVAGVAFAYAPFKLAQGGHLHVLWTGGVPLSLFLLVRGYRRSRPGLVFAGWLVATWQLTMGWNVGLPFAYLLLALSAVALAVAWRRGIVRRLAPPLVAASVAGVLLFGATGFWLSRPYQRVVEAEPQVRRDLATVSLFSPSIYGFASAPQEARVWGPRTAAFREHLTFAVEQSIFPGVIVLVLAGWGLMYQGWPRALRYGLAGSAVLFGFLSLGAHTEGLGRFYPYRLLFELAPGFQGLRTPGRLMTFTALALGLLAAAGAVNATRNRAHLVLALAAIVALEGLGAPIPTAQLPPKPRGIEAAGEELQLHLPLNIGFPSEAQYMLWTTDRFPLLVNGYSGLVPQRLRALETLIKRFPDAASIDALRVFGVKTVVLYPALARDSAWRDAHTRSIEGLGIERRPVGDVVIFVILPA